MSWVRDFRVFANDTSAHGVKYIFEGPSKLVKLLFLLCWIALSIYSSHVIIGAIAKFIDSPTGTKYEVIVEGEEGAPQVINFPTISVCSHNKVKKSYLNKPENAVIKEYYETIDQYNVSMMPRLVERFNDPDDSLNTIKNMTYQELLEGGAPEFNRLLHCEQRAKMCQFLPGFAEKGGVFAEMETSITGRCWRVNPDHTLKGKVGDYGALKMYFWADVQDYSVRSADSPAQGFTVAFHHNTSYGSTMFSGFLMSPGTYYKADLRLKKETREPPPSGKCNDKLGKTFYGNYTEGSCVLQCKDKFMMEDCGCVNVVPPLNDGTYRSCTLEEWVTCGQQSYMAWYRNYTNPEAAEPFCSCETACHETRYEAQVSSSSVSTPFADHMFKNVQGYISTQFSDPSLGILYNTSTDITDNIMVLEVLFSSMQTSEIKEIITYTSENLLADIGGVLGLFLGASLFTIMEFFQFILYSILKHCFGYKSGKKDEDYEGVTNEKENGL